MSPTKELYRFDSINIFVAGTTTICRVVSTNVLPKYADLPQALYSILWRCAPSRLKKTATTIEISRCKLGYERVIL